MRESARTRRNMLISFDVANRLAARGSLVVNGATAAGMLLHACGSALSALEMCARMPAEGPWPTAGVYLSELVSMESSEAAADSCWTVPR